MSEDLTATATITIDAPKGDVWKALTDPAAIRQYMFGAEVSSAWKVGSPITWKGEMKGQPYEDKGVILRFEPEDTLQYSHFSPSSGKPDAPENYHTVTIRLSDADGKTKIVLTQDNNPTAEARKHAEQNWTAMLEGLKKVAAA